MSNRSSTPPPFPTAFDGESLRGILKVDDGYQADKEGDGEEDPKSLCSSTVTLTQDRVDIHHPQLCQRPSTSSQYEGMSDQESKTTKKPPCPHDVLVEDTASSTSNNAQLLEEETNVDGEVILRQRFDFHPTRNSPIKKRAQLSQILKNAQTSSSSSSPSSDEETTYAIRRIDKASFSSGKSPSSSKHSARQLQPGPLLEIRASTCSDSSDVEQQSVSMHVLAKLVNPKILSEVKSHLRKASRCKRDSLQLPPSSPALEWEIRQKKKTVLSKAQATRIKAGQRVRECLRATGVYVNDFYLERVKLGLVEEVKALFTMAKVDPKRGFNKNYKDSDKKSALLLAIENDDVPMIQLLVQSNVDLDNCIFHLIRRNCVEGLKILLKENKCIHSKIEDEDPYFQAGLTPMLLASHDNNYKMLSLLYDCEHRLNKSPGFSAKLDEAWESSNERRMICEARIQPAYITLMSEVYRKDPMKICLHEIKTLRKYQILEHEFSDFYKSLIKRCEGYMCALLDEIRSSNELAQLFKYEFKKLEESEYHFRDLLATVSRSELCERLELLEKANKHELRKFVTHQQSQLALAYLRYRSVPFMRTHSLFVRNFISITMGLLFPIWTIAYLIYPKSNLGTLITLPTFSFSCHMMSDITFAVLLLLNISEKTIGSDELGSSPSILEWLIFFWILGKWVQEIQECLNRGPKEYFRDHWNYTDILLLLLFTISIGLRIFDILSNMDLTEQVPRLEWDQYEPRLVAEGLQAWAYVFVFIRLLGIVRVDRNLGPLQISLARMMTDVLKFLALFCLVICAFGFGLSELYWYYGTEEGSKLLCSYIKQTEGNLTSCDLYHTELFGSIPKSIATLFWSLFGLLDIDRLSLSGKHAYTETIGRSLIGIYHVIAIIVMLNMLIAMMSKSYEETSENEEIEWKFHRTSMWIRFIRREVVRPPPMNLIPNPWRFKETYLRFKNFCKTKCCGRRDSNHTEDVKPHCEDGTRMHKYESKQIPIDEYAIEMEQIDSMDDCEENVIPSSEDDEISKADNKVAFKQPHLVALPKSNGNDKGVLAKLVCRYKLKNLI